MSNVLSGFKREARKIASSLGAPKFYIACAADYDISHEHFFDNPIIFRLREDVIPFLYDDYGHGIEHSKNVAIDAGAIVLAESKEQDRDGVRRMVLLAQVAGLLHDVCRLDLDHARHSAETSRSILASYPLSDEDRDIVAYAIANHENTGPVESAGDQIRQTVSDALHDADVFRWGPDHFVTTLWEICDYQDWPISATIERFPTAMERAAARAAGLRTATGRTYGPDLMERGLIVGRRMYALMREYCETHPCD
ncbi:MAG: HD domain-containing protein [Desulfocurvibacter africanus]